MTAVEAPTAESAATGVLEALDHFMCQELDVGAQDLVETLTDRFPDAGETAVLEAADETVVADERDALRARQRLAEELPRAFAVSDTAERESAVHALLEAERERIEGRRASRTPRALGRLAAGKGRLG